MSLSGVKFILNKAFANLEDQTSVAISSSVVSIGRSAFENNSMLNIDLTSATNLVSIGDSCFKKCKNLQALCIPDSVLYVGSGLLLDALNLTEFSFNANLTIPDYCCYNCINLATITISNLTQIGDSAFAYCRQLQALSLSNSSDLEIGREAFLSCSGLATLYINTSSLTIKEKGFFGCTNLQEVQLNVSNLLVLEDAFAGCYKIIEVCIPNTINLKPGSPAYGYLGFYAAGVVNSPKSIVVENGFKLYGDIQNGRIDYSTAYIVGYEGNDTEIVLPEVYGIKSYAFYNNTELTKINIPNLSNKLHVVGACAFDKCEKLVFNEFDEGYYLGDNLIYMGPITENIETVRISNRAKFVYSEALFGCNNIHSIESPVCGDRRHFNDNIYQEGFSSVFGHNYFEGGNLVDYLVYDIDNNKDMLHAVKYYIPSQINNIHIIDGDIPDGAFINWTNLTSLVIDSPNLS